MKHSTLFVRSVAALALALPATAAFAATYVVGLPVSPGQCTHANVQAAVDAAAASPGPDTVRITRSVSWTAQQINVNTPQDLELTGGFPSCSSTTADSTRTILNGAGGQQRPVLTVRGDGIVRLRKLTLTGGDQAGSTNGGGLFYEGGGVLDLADMSITGNSAYDGGGIYATGTSILAEMVIGADVSISNNTARNSGGGMVSKSLETTIGGPNTALLFNKALGQGGGGYGGGLVVVSAQFKSLAYISSSGIGGIGVLYGNEAVHGGGLAVLAGQDSEQEASALVFSTDTAQPVRINGNLASVRGGGIYTQSDADSGMGSADASVVLWRAALNDNRAPDGAAAYVDRDEAVVGFRRSRFQFTGLQEAAACPVGTPCNEMVGNSTGNTTGAVLRNRGSVAMQRVDIRGNAGGRLLYATDYPFTTIKNSLLADNTAALELLRSADEGEPGNVTMSHVTIAGNTIGAPHTLFVDHLFELDRSLIAQPGKLALASSPGTRSIGYVLSNDTANMLGGAVLLANPRFVDPANGDYHLRAGSYAVDFAPENGGTDLDGRAHTLDMPVGGFAGRTADAGAYERPALQPLVLNPDFDTNMNLWTGVSESFWDATQNAVGIAGSGSVRVPFGFDPESVSAPKIIGRVQCVHLPGPGTYRLDGWGRVSFASQFGSNSAQLRWELRYNGGAQSCGDGAANVTGAQVLATNSTAWRRPGSPAPIVVTAAQWTRNTSLSVQLDVGAAPGAEPNAWFDGIVLELDSSDVIFANGFD